MHISSIHMCRLCFPNNINYINDAGLAQVLFFSSYLESLKVTKRKTSQKKKNESFATL